MNLVQSEDLKLYRKRLIPQEYRLLKDDVIVLWDEEHLITTWNTLNPKAAFCRGSSCYFLKKGFKISKFYRQDGSLLYWYCDIVEYTQDRENNALIVTDLLADVVVFPGGLYQVVDLDELAQAYETGLLTKGQLSASLRQLNSLLTDYLYRGRFDRLSSVLEDLGL